MGISWRIDETYIKIKGDWHYLYRAVDKAGDAVDFVFPKHRDATAAKTFFTKAILSNEFAEKVTIDKSGANIAGLNAMNCQLIVFYLLGCIFLKINIRQIKYLNNIVEQDHRGIKGITHPMMGFKAFHSAKATLNGIELYRTLKKGRSVDTTNTPAFEQFYALAV